ncbi:MAG: phosphorylase [Flavobacteriales bacterium]|nr:phosphorylase [Flavobacteriales bacterium]
MINPSELVLNSDGSIYHLKLHPEQLADEVILVGDPGRVSLISSYFDSIDHKVENREFITHTGEFNGKGISVLATGIGTDNIDIVLNELDALVNVDLEKREIKDQKRSLKLLRIGTCGSIQKDVLADQIVLSSHAVGLDGLLNYYDWKAEQEENEILNSFLSHCNWPDNINTPYLVAGSNAQIERFSSIEGVNKGITLTAPGFYGPQGRSIRLKAALANQNEMFADFHHKGHRLVNYEMETSALYGLSRLLGHDAATLCLVVANRTANSFSKNYPQAMKKLVEAVLERL